MWREVLEMWQQPQFLSSFSIFLILGCFKNEEESYLIIASLAI